VGCVSVRNTDLNEDVYGHGRERSASFVRLLQCLWFLWEWRNSRAPRRPPCEESCKTVVAYTFDVYANFLMMLSYIYLNSLQVNHSGGSVTLILSKGPTFWGLCHHQDLIFHSFCLSYSLGQETGFSEGFRCFSQTCMIVMLIEY
jgi:hypothetical protein